MVKCSQANCRLIAAYCYQGDPSPKYCNGHKMEGMIRYIVSALPETCRASAEPQKLSWTEIVKRSMDAKNPKLVPEIVVSQLENKTSEEKLEICNAELNAPERSELERKRKPSNTHARNRARGPTAPKKTKFKKISSSSRVAEFPEEPFRADPNCIFCLACREDVSLKRDRIVQHTASNKHLAAKDKRENDMKQNITRSKLLEEYHNKKLVGPDLEIVSTSVAFEKSEREQAFRLDLASTWLKCGFSFYSLNKFAPFLERYTFKVPDQSHMKQYIPIIEAAELNEIKMEEKGRLLCVFFDGTTRVCEAFAVVLRFVLDDGTIVQRLVKISMIDDEMTGEMLAREIINILLRLLQIEENNVLVFVKDRCPSNVKAARQLDVFFQNAEDVGCFAHTLDHIGEKFNCPTLKRFWGHWIAIFNHSKRAKRIFLQTTGSSFITYCKTRWWSRDECYRQLLVLWGDLLKVLQTINASRLQDGESCTNAIQMLSDIRTLKTLQVELAASVDGADPFIKATYALEGDGPLAFVTFDKMAELNQFTLAPHLPNLTAICKQWGGDTQPPTDEFQALYQQGMQCIISGFNYFNQTIWADDAQLNYQLQLFKLARFLVPARAIELHFSLEDVENFNLFKVVRNGFIDMGLLRAELPLYLAAADGVALHVDLVQFWYQRKDMLPGFCKLFAVLMLLQPSSAACERVFSVLTRMLGDQQDSALQDYVQTQVMLEYNKRRI